MGCRTNGLSDQWAVEPMGCRTTGKLPLWHFLITSVTISAITHFMTAETIKAQFLGFNDVMSSLRIGHSGTIEHVMLPGIAECALVDLFLVVICFRLCLDDKC